MAETSTRARRDSGDLSALLLPELKKIAANLGIEGASDMKKPDLVQAISDLQAANREAARLEREARRAARMQRRNRNSDNDGDGDEDSTDSDNDEVAQSDDSTERNSSEGSSSDNGRDNRGYDRDRDFRRDRHRDRGDRGDRGRDRHRDRGDRGERGRDREIVISEDDVLLPVGGLLDILENYAFIRTGGYLPGPNDVYVSLHQVRRYGLRKGDVVTGQVRQPREGERREKFNA
ncbi:MAG: transcription termination factor Rho, partial [Actinobacteria bacterium]|nr:transcription termination factor Rho [Actinomycetota bacterium]